jgi:secreted PhoX family phosphatase
MRNIDDGKVCNNSNNQTFQEVVEARMSRRGFLGSGLAAAAAFSLGGVSALLKAVPASADAIGGPLVRFQGIPVSDADTVVVPLGYTAEVLIAWGDPVSKGPAFAQDASNSARTRHGNGACIMMAWCTFRSTGRGMAFL